MSIPVEVRVRRVGRLETALADLDECLAESRCTLCTDRATMLTPQGRPTCIGHYLTPGYDCVCGLCGAEYLASYRSWICPKCRAEGEARDRARQVQDQLRRNGEEAQLRDYMERDRG